MGGPSPGPSKSRNQDIRDLLPHPAVLVCKCFCSLSSHCCVRLRRDALMDGPASRLQSQLSCVPLISLYFQLSHRQLLPHLQLLRLFVRRRDCHQDQAHRPRLPELTRPRARRRRSRPQQLPAKARQKMGQERLSHSMQILLQLVLPYALCKFFLSSRGRRFFPRTATRLPAPQPRYLPSRKTQSIRTAKIKCKMIATLSSAQQHTRPQIQLRSSPLLVVPCLQALRFHLHLPQSR